MAQEEQKLPPLDLIEKHHRFPGTFTFKVIGDTGTEFPDRVLAAVRTALAIEHNPQHSVRTSSQGRHIAVTIDAFLETSKEVHQIYRQLLTVDGVRALF